MRQTRGYSIIEIIVYLALFAVLTIAFVNTLIISMKSFSEIQINRDLISGGTGAFERMTREIKNATSINTGASTFNTSPGVLSLNTTDSGGSAKTVLFDVSNNSLRLSENGTVTGNLLNPNINVTNLVFKQITTGAGTAVRIEMTIQNTKGLSIKENFYTTAILKGSY